MTSSTGRNGSIAIHQDADLWIGRVSMAGENLLHTLAPDRHAWIQVAEGSVTLNGLPLAAGDGASVSGETALRFTASGAAQVLLFDLN